MSSIISGALQASKGISCLIASLVISTEKANWKVSILSKSLHIKRKKKYIPLFILLSYAAYGLKL